MAHDKLHKGTEPQTEGTDADLLPFGMVQHDPSLADYCSALGPEAFGLEIERKITTALARFTEAGFMVGSARLGSELGIDATHVYTHLRLIREKQALAPLGLEIHQWIASTNSGFPGTSLRRKEIFSALGWAGASLDPGALLKEAAALKRGRLPLQRNVREETTTGRPLPSFKEHGAQLGETKLASNKRRLIKLLCEYTDEGEQVTLDFLSQKLELNRGIVTRLLQQLRDGETLPYHLEITEQPFSGLTGLRSSKLYSVAYPQGPVELTRQTIPELISRPDLFPNPEEILRRIRVAHPPHVFSKKKLASTSHRVKSEILRILGEHAQRGEVVSRPQIQSELANTTRHSIEACLQSLIDNLPSSILQLRWIDLPVGPNGQQRLGYYLVVP